jgi:cytochrome c oxidase subunit II
MVVLMKRILFLLALLTPLFAEEKKADRTIAITAERFFFTPSKITVKEGETVDFVVMSEDTEHGFRVPGAGIDATIPPRGKGELRIRFTATKKGKFPFECSRACGAGHNLMRGEIAVK